MPQEIKLGDRVKTFRERLEFSVETLAEKSGVSADIIRAVESNEVYPVLGVMVKLARGLGQRLGTFTDDVRSADPLIIRKEDRLQKCRSHQQAASGFNYFPLGYGKHDRHMEPYFIELDGDALVEPSSHEGEEFIVVMEGEVSLEYGTEKYVLKAGDSMYYNSVVTHAVRAATKQAAIYAVVFMPF